MANEIAQAPAVAETPAEETVVRDEAGRFAAAPEPEVQSESEPDPELLEAHVRTAQVRQEAARLGLLPTLGDELPIEQWAQLRRLQVESGIKNLPAESLGKLDASASQPGEAAEPNRDQEILDSYHQRKEDFKAQHPDYDEVVGKLELAPDVAAGVELALLELGPQVAYEIARNPQLVAELSDLTPAAAVARVGGIAERMGQAGQLYDSWAQQHLQTDIPQHVITEFQKKAATLRSQLSDDERSMAGVVGVAPHVAKTILALGRPELIVSLIRDPATAGRLNQMHPMGAAAELASMARELDQEPDKARRTPGPSPIKPIRRASPTSTGLSDDLDIKTWVSRRQAQIRDKRG